MKKPLKIGGRTFPSKKEALVHYKGILNAYGFGQSLNDADFDDVLNLLNYNYFNTSNKIEQEPEQIELNAVAELSPLDAEEVLIEDIKVSKVQYGTKCFEVFYSNRSSEFISYLMIIKDWSYTPEKLFSVACRNCIQRDLVAVKQVYFKENAANGLVKCQETGQLSNWAELAVDHRQPNTLSIIIDRFKELNNVVLDEIEYKTSSDNLILFKDPELTQKFVQYHQEKANLRVVRKERNASRTAMARVKRSAKDLVIKPSDQLSLF